MDTIWNQLVSSQIRGTKPNLGVDDYREGNGERHSYSSYFKCHLMVYYTRVALTNCGKHTVCVVIGFYVIFEGVPYYLGVPY